jgi:hypothetical protein
MTPDIHTAPTKDRGKGVALSRSIATVGCAKWLIRLRIPIRESTHGEIENLPPPWLDVQFTI